MGREIRRVPVDFDWPLHERWPGFVMPDELHSLECKACDGSGYNPATRKIADDWYDQAGFGYVNAQSMTDADLLHFIRFHGARWTYQYGTARDGTPADRPPWKVLGECRRWMHDITQDEVQALVDGNRLYDFTHIWSRETGWARRPDGYTPTAAEVNEWSYHFIGHDCINQSICVKRRAERLGVYGLCDTCKGDGQVWRDDAHQQAHEAWEETDPPEGPAYQLWETVSEGSPASPPFLSPADLAAWLVEHDDSVTSDTTYDQWLKFIRDVQWAPSMIGVTGASIASGVKELSRQAISDG